MNIMGDKIMDLNNVETLADYAAKHGLDYPKLRRMARKNEFDAPFKFGKTWFINADVPAPVIPERKRKTRDDGRTRFIVYIDRDGDEIQRIMNVVGVDNVIDQRDVRVARKLAAAAAVNDIMAAAHEIANGIDA